jgi:hypothetical protein
MSWDRILEATVAGGIRIADALGILWAAYGLELVACLLGGLVVLTVWQARATVRLRAELASEIRRSEYWQAASERSGLNLRRSLRALEGQFQTLAHEQEATRLRGSRVDFTVARSLAQTGANCSQLEDCGLSRGEAQLITALHGRAAR